MPRHDLQGNLDLVVLKTLAQRGRLHGYGIVLHIHSESDELLQVEEGFLYPALHQHGAERMDQFRMGSHRNGEAGKVLPPDRGWSETTE